MRLRLANALCRAMLAALFSAVHAYPVFASVSDWKGYVATFSPDGMLISWFDAGLVSNQRFESTDVDSAGNVWVGRRDFGPSPGANPNDKIVKHSPDGVALLELNGPLARPQSAAFDSAGNVYVAGFSEIDNKTAILKFAAEGSFVASFGAPIGSNPDDWQDLLITSDDRIFAAGDLSGTLAEFTTGGSKIHSIGLGVLRRPWGLTLSQDGNALWNLDFANGPGVNRVNKYDLNLNAISAFDTALVSPPWDNLLNGSIQTSLSGNLLIGASIYGAFETPVVHELSAVGTLIATREFPSIFNLLTPDVNVVDVQTFALTPDGNYVFGFAFGVKDDSPDIPEPATVLLSVTVVGLLSTQGNRRRFHRKIS